MSRQCSTAPLPESEPPPFIVRMFYSSYFYLSLASGLGAFVAWMIFEPFFDDDRVGRSRFQWAAILMFPTVMGFVGLFLGAAEGIMCRNLQRAADLRGRRAGDRLRRRLRRVDSRRRSFTSSWSHRGRNS